MVEWPWSGYVVGCELVVLLVVEEPPDPGGRPPHGVAVEVLGEWASEVAGVAGAAVQAAVAETVKRALDVGGVDGDVLHDVDLGACRPFGFVDVVAEHPEGRPGACFGWNLGAGLDPSVASGDPLLGDEASAGDPSVRFTPSAMASFAVCR